MKGDRAAGGRAAAPRAGPLPHLPVEVTSFVGRRRQLGDVKRLLADQRLVTLTGAGGTGKTRLAVRVATELRRAFRDGAWFVDLTQARGSGVPGLEADDPEVPAHLLAAALGLPECPAGSPLLMLADQLADRQMLLIRDNCEHLVHACALLADALLRRCAGLRILATSRDPLAVDGEALYPVPPLPTPVPRRPPHPTELRGCASVALFVARARTALPSFQLTERNQLAVADLCHRLEGLPLAIELAAARVRVLEPEQILDRMTDRFGLLARESRGTPQRQRSLRACVDWSFDLCTKREQLLWARLAVFAGGFQLDAVEGICADETLPAEDLLDLVAELIDKSILLSDTGNRDQARYRMLETIREYGLGKLAETGEATTIRRPTGVPPSPSRKQSRTPSARTPSRSPPPSKRAANGR